MTGSQSLERGLAVLGLLDKSPEPLGVREIARRLGIAPTIVQRLINTLMQENYLEQQADTKRYTIGYRALGLGTSLSRRDNLIAAAQPVLEELAVRHELNGYLGALRGSQAIYILSVQSEGPIAIKNVPGEMARLHTTAMGKVLLAALPHDAAATLLGPGPLERVTPMSVTDPDILLQQLPDIRHKGFSVVRGENLPGVLSVGAPVRGVKGAVRAALSVAFAERLSPGMTLAAATKIVVNAAARVSRTLGWTGD